MKADALQPEPDRRQAAREGADRRREPRRRALKGGRIVFNAGYGAFACTIRNLSDHGALLDLESTAGVPGTFELHFDSGGEPRRCTVAWRDARRLGVGFD